MYEFILNFKLSTCLTSNWTLVKINLLDLILNYGIKFTKQYLYEAKFLKMYLFLCMIVIDGNNEIIVLLTCKIIKENYLW